MDRRMWSQGGPDVELQGFVTPSAIGREASKEKHSKQLPFQSSVSRIVTTIATKVPSWWPVSPGAGSHVVPAFSTHIVPVSGIVATAIAHKGE